MSMFPIRLEFHLAAPPGSIREESLHALLPGLSWGSRNDLLKHSDEWPDAVVLIDNQTDEESEVNGDFPVELNFVHFPNRVTGNDAAVLPVKLALLRLLASSFECRVLCDAQGFFVEGEVPTMHPYAWSESFVCQGGRLFGGAVPIYEAINGARPSDGWVPVDDTPEIRLRSDGTLENQFKTIERVAKWIKHREVSHLSKPGHPTYPKQPSKPTRRSTPEEIEAEIAEEFPTDEELDQEEAEWEAYAERLEAWEKGVGTTSSKQLISSGVELPSPDSLDDEQLRHKLWQIIRGLRKKNTYLHNTDHLSDRELYAWLWEEGLNDMVMDLSGLSDCGCHTSPIGSGDEESTRISLIYYDSAEQRADWKAQWPEDEIPEHIDPPHDRDRLLPKRDLDTY